MNTRENLDLIDEEPRGTRFYCPRLAQYGYTRVAARRLARQGFDVIAEHDVTLVVSSSPAGGLGEGH